MMNTGRGGGRAGANHWSRAYEDYYSECSVGGDESEYESMSNDWHDKWYNILHQQIQYTREMCVKDYKCEINRCIKLLVCVEDWM